MAYAILERTSGLEPSSETTAPRYLKLVTVPNFCPFTFIPLWMPLALFVISFGHYLSSFKGKYELFFPSHFSLILLSSARLVDIIFSGY